MDRVINGTLTATLRHEIQEYAGDVHTPFGQSQLYFTENADQQVFCITIPHISSDLPAELLIMAHIADDHIVIDIDNTDKPLVEALLQAGVLPEQIVLAWQLPDKSRQTLL